jgi:ribonuclease E
VAAEEDPTQPRGRRRRRGSNSPFSASERESGVPSKVEAAAEDAAELTPPAALQEPGEPADVQGEAPTPDETGAEEGKSRRRRRRRRRKGGAATADEAALGESAEGPAEEPAAEDSELEDEASDEVLAEIEPAVDEDDEEIDDLSNWTVPSWAEIVASLYRPER